MSKKNKFSNITILSAVFFFMLFLSTGLSSAAGLLNVTELLENGNCTSIQRAINNSSEGDTILVYGEAYTENLRISVPGLILKSVEGLNVVLTPQPLDSISPVITILADNVTICGFNINGPFRTGIKSQGKNGLILKNNTINTSFIGISLEEGSNCTLENNSIYGADFGVSLKNSCKNNSLKQNIIKSCVEGLLLRDSCTENRLSGNNFSGNFRALWLENSCSDNNLTSNNFANNSISAALEDDCSGNILDNNTIEKAQYGFYLSHSCNNNTLSKNNASDSHYAYYLKSSCENNSLKNNIASGNLYGFYLSRSNYNTLYGNRLSNNSRGIFLEACNNTTLLSNTAYKNRMEGVFLDASSENRIAGNNVSNNSEGIELDGLCNGNILSKNNTISFNKYGLIFSSSSNNILNDTFVMFNSKCGISLENSGNNTIYNNLFNNTKNAEDDNQDENSKNTWNISTIKIKGKKNIYGGPSFGGNYWSDYKGNDSNGDGFGDKLYNRSNITDKLPLFDDVILPVITVRTPRETTYFITSIPIFAYANEEISNWTYKIDGKEESFTKTGPLTAEGHLDLSEGDYTLRVFATDLSDNSNFTEVKFTVDKDADAERNAPLISIMTPEENRTYTTGSLSLYASANESIWDWWYELDGLETHEFEYPSVFTARTSLELANGSYSIKVYGLDLAGNMNSTSVNFTVGIEKPEDKAPPTIDILSPLNESYSIRPVPLYASADENISRWWYTLNGSRALEFNLSTKRTANGSLYLQNGSYTLEVYGVDIAGNLNITNVCFGVELKKPEDLPPLITISSPVNMTYNNSCVYLNASANESIEEWWYVLDKSSSALTFSDLGDRNASSYMLLDLDGEHRVEVWGRDTAGNLNSSTVNFRVDTTPPILNISSPDEGASYNSSTLLIFVSSNEKVSKWEYELDQKGPRNFSDFTPRWADVFLTELEDKNYVIEIRAWDLVGNCNLTLVNFSVDTTTSGDGSLPLITIRSPEEKVYSESATPLNASANESISEWWYVLDSSGKLTFDKTFNINNESLALSVLENITEGKHRLKVYGKDLANNLNSSARNFTIDTKKPRITIISPVNGSEFVIKDGKSYAVYLKVNLSELCNFSYSTGNEFINKTNVSEFNETLKLGVGSYNITLLAEDAAGNQGWNYTNITVYEKGYTPDEVSSSDGGGRRNFDRVLAALMARMGSDEGAQEEGSDSALELTPMLKSEEYSPAGSNKEPEEKDSIFSPTNAGILLLATSLLILFIKYMMYFRREK